MPDVAEALNLLELDGLEIDTTPALRRGRPIGPIRHPGDFKDRDYNGEDFDDIPGLHQFDRDPSAERAPSLAHERKDEKGWHRMVAICILSGKTNQEIANLAQVNKTTIRDLRAQRWFQQLLVTLAGETHQDIQGMLRGEAVATIEKLVQLRDGAKQEKVQLDAAKVLLEQAHGKPIVQVITQSVRTSYENEKDEMSAIQEELRLLRERKAKAIPI